MAERTLTGFLKIALAPAHTTMYIWGGGWNAAGDGAGTDALRIGPSPKWKEFYNKQSESYDFKEHKFEHGSGLDCSGFVGWAVYNLLGGNGYVTQAQAQAGMLGSLGLGSCIKNCKKFMPGDIVSASGHVYIVIGECTDTSAVIVHSSPPGVQLCGTSTRGGNEISRAAALVRKYTAKYYPDWYKKLGSCRRGLSYFQDCTVFRWSENVLPDCDNLKSMCAEQILGLLYSRK